MFESLLQGLGAILDPLILLAMVTGLVGGVLAGAIPGLSATMAVALLLPLTYSMEPLVALSFMAGIHNGAAYGGSIPAILLRIPGTPAAVATTFDGYPMSRKGETVYALKLSALSSAVGGVASAIALMLLAPPLAQAALAFGPPEIFWVSVFGLVSTSVLIGKDPLKGLMAACIGLVLGSVGIDTVTGAERLTFGLLELATGLPLAIVLIALFGLPAALQIAERSGRSASGEPASEDAPIASRFANPKPSRPMREWCWRRILPAWVRGSGYGIFVGILPGLGGAVSSVIAYGSERRASRTPEAFGSGAIEGVAVAESANNADNAASMIPALTLAIPGSGVAAVVLAGLLIHGLEPGSQLFVDDAPIVFGYMWAFLITSVLLVVVGGALAIRVFSRILDVPPAILAPVIVILTVVGAFTYQNSFFAVYLLALLGVFGYFLDRLGFPAPPAILALFLGPKVEFNLRISLRISQDDWSIFFTRPISAVIALATLALVIAGIWRALDRERTAGHLERNEP